MISLGDFIKENLLSSFDADKTINCLNEISFVNKCSKIMQTNYSTILVEIDYRNYKQDIFEQKLNIVNYFVTNYNLSDNILKLSIKPRITECVTEYIYNECKGIIYHLTTKEKWKKIQQNNGLVPKNVEYEFRPKQTFLFVKKPNFDSESLKELSKTLSKFSDAKDILLEINLHNIDKKLNFYIDPAFTSNNILSVYTREFIPIKKKNIIISKYVI